MLENRPEGVEYAEWSDARSGEYKLWSDTRSECYDHWSDMRSDIYDFYTDTRGKLYRDDIEKAKKEVEDFREDVIKMQE